MTRYLIAAGTSDYGADLDLPFATQDVDRVVRLFTQRLGYTQALADLAHNPATDALRRRFGRWLRDRQADDVVVFYYAGHGDKSADGRHYLLCADSEFDALTSTALATEDLLRLWSDAGHPVTNLLFVLDVCYAGAGLAQMHTVAKDLAATRRREEADGVWLLAAARARDEAEESLFVDTLERAIDTAKAGQRAPFLAIDDVVDTVNADLAERGRSQRAVCLPRFTRDLPPFIPNPKYWPDAPPEGVDLASQRKLRRLDLERHFEPRSRGVERGTDLGELFCGRTRVLAELTGWLTTGDGRARVVTGSPGSGKSSVLGRVVMTADPDLAIHARQLRLDQMVAAFGGIGIEAEDADALLMALRERTDPLVVVVDALDEASDPIAIARDLLGPMSALPSVRLLVGTRPEHLPHLRPAIVEIDLDRPEYTGATDVADYVTKILLADHTPGRPTPYRADPGLARTVAEGVATRAGGNFLVARMHALHLAYAPEPVDVTVAGWQESLDSDIGAVFDEYLSRFGDDADRLRRLLTPLAYAEGAGLPWDGLWAPLATVLSGVPCTDDDIAWLLREANSYVVEAVEHDRSVYRLYHQALADHLRRRLPVREAHRRFVAALRADDPFDAHPYVQRHLAQHAAAAGMLDELIADPAFVLASDFGALRSALPSVTSPAGELIAAVVEQAMPFWPSAPHLQMAARRCGANDFADRVPRLTWSTPWADAIPRTPHRVLAHGDVTSLAVADLPQHGPVVVVAFTAGAVGLFEVDTGNAISVLQTGSAYTDIAPVADEATLTVLVVAGGRSWRWDVTASKATQLDISASCDAVWATADDDGKALGLFVERDGTVHVYDVSAERVSARLPPLRPGGSPRFFAATGDGRTTLFGSHTFEEGMFVLDLSAGAWRSLPRWSDADRAPYTVVTSRGLPHVVFETSPFSGHAIRDVRDGHRTGTHYVGRVLAAGTLSTGQDVVLIESDGFGLGVWSADDVLESGGYLGEERLIDALLTAAEHEVSSTEHTDMTLAEFVHLAHVQPDQLGVDGPAIAAVVTRQGGSHVFVACQRDGRLKTWPAIDPSGTPAGAGPRRTVSTAGRELTFWVPGPPSLQTLAGHDGIIRHAAFTRRSSGQDVVITAGSDGFIRRWDVCPGAAAVPVSDGEPQFVRSVAVHGEWIVHTTAGSNEIRARRLADGIPAASSVPVDGNGSLVRVENAPDVSIVVDASRQAHLLSWGRPLIPLMTDVDQVAASMQPDGTVVVVSTDYSETTRTHRLAGRELFLLGTTADGPKGFRSFKTATLGSGDTVVVAEGEEVIEVWQAESLARRGEITFGGNIGSLKALATGRAPGGLPVALVVTRKALVVIDLDNGRLMGELPGGRPTRHNTMRVLSDGRHLVFGYDFLPSPTLYVWDLGRMSLVTSIQLPVQVSDLDVSEDGIVVLATQRGLITIKL